MGAPAFLLVVQPFVILSAAAVFLAAHQIQQRFRYKSLRHPRSLLMAAAVCSLFAAWEWIVLIHTPEANIRVDRMVIWPVLLVASIWFLVRALRERYSGYEPQFTKCGGNAHI